MDENFARFQSNLKQTQLGVNFTKRLFTDPDSLSSAQIVTTLNGLGLNLPKEAQMGADAAQILSSGSTAIEAYQTAQSVGAVASPSAATMQLLNKYGSQNGWIDSQTSSILTVATDVALIYASGGTNVMAWISLASEIGFAGAKNDAAALGLAQKWALSTYQKMMTTQFQNTVKAANDLANGKVGVFGYLVEMADTAPALFENCIVKNPALAQFREMFPGLNFIPLQNASITGWGRSSDWMGNSSKKTFTINYATIGNMTQTEAFKFIWKKVFLPQLQGYFQIEKNLQSKGHASFTKHAILSAIDVGSNYEITQNRDILRKLLRNGITPHDLGDDILEKIAESKQNQALSGAFNLSVKELSRNTVLFADQIGRIDAVLQNSQARTQIENFYNLSEENMNATVGYWNETTGETYQGSIDMRSLSNFVGILDTMDLVFNDPLYQKFRGTIPELSKYETIFPTLSEFKSEINRLMGISQARKINYLAKINVANFLGAKSVNDLQQVGPLREGAAQVYKLKGS